MTNWAPALDYADLLKADKEVVLAAVTNLVGSFGTRTPSQGGQGGTAAVMTSGIALMYADPLLRADKEVVLAVVTNFALLYVRGPPSQGGQG